MRLGSSIRIRHSPRLFPHNGRFVEVPWRLALITVLQFMEELPDRQAADVVRGRIDWKYLLGLDLADLGFDASLLSEFRKRLIEGGIFFFEPFKLTQKITDKAGTLPADD